MDDHDLWMAFFQDPDEHTLAVMQEAPKGYAPHPEGRTDLYSRADRVSHVQPSRRMIARPIIQSLSSSDRNGSSSVKWVMRCWYVSLGKRSMPAVRSVPQKLRRGPKTSNTRLM